MKLNNEGREKDRRFCEVEMLSMRVNNCYSFNVKGISLFGVFN